MKNKLKVRRLSQRGDTFRSRINQIPNKLRPRRPSAPFSQRCAGPRQVGRQATCVR